MDGLDIKAERERVATAIRAAVPEKWTVYAAPPTSSALPALIVRPGADYIRRVTARVWDVSLDLEVVQPVAAGAEGQDVLDDVLAELLPQLLSIPELRVPGVSSAGRYRTEGGVPVIVATIPVSL
jgi:hypothetical protein